MSAVADRLLWADLCRIAARRRRRVEIMRAHADVPEGHDLPRCHPRRPDGLRDKVIYPSEAAAQACCDAFAAELGEQQRPYRCKRRRRRRQPPHWHLTSQR